MPWNPTPAPASPSDAALLASLRIDPDDVPYAALHKLLADAFSPQDLRRFCRHRSEFREATTLFGPGDGLADMIDKLLEYCNTRLLWDQLLAALIQERPARLLKASSALGQAAAPAPMSAEEITERHQADVERGRPYHSRARGRQARACRQGTPAGQSPQPGH